MYGFFFSYVCMYDVLVLLGEHLPGVVVFDPSQNHEGRAIHSPEFERLGCIFIYLKVGRYELACNELFTPAESGRVRTLCRMKGMPRPAVPDVAPLA